MKNTSAMKAFTQTLAPTWLTPAGPSASVATSPRPVNKTMIPRQNVNACAKPPFWPTKKDIVMGIMGKTQGVKTAASPNPNASTRNDPRSESCSALAGTGRLRLPGFAST